MKNSIGICRELIKLLQQGQILGSESVSSCAEKVESLTVTEENCFLRLVNYEL